MQYHGRCDAVQNEKDAVAPASRGTNLQRRQALIRQLEPDATQWQTVSWQTLVGGWAGF
jgi:hypothetical protein